MLHVFIRYIGDLYIRVNTILRQGTLLAYYLGEVLASLDVS